MASLYKIAPSKDSLVLLAIGRWGELTLANLEARADGADRLGEGTLLLHRRGREPPPPVPGVLRRRSTALSRRQSCGGQYRDRYIDRFIELVTIAQEAGEVRPINSRFFGEMLRQIGFVTRDERVLRETGLTSEQAVLEVDRIVWDGIRVS